MEIFITSDTHFCHMQPFLYEPRGFTSVEEMNEAIIEKWNSVVKPNDRVIHLGDTMLNDNEKGIECLKRLNGEICLIYGNHDSPARQKLIQLECPSVISLGYAHMFKYGKMSIYLSHYPTLTANFDVEMNKHFTRHVLNICGHTHRKEKFLDEKNPFMYNACLDAHNCYPVHIDDIITDCRKQFLSLKGV